MIKHLTCGLSLLIFCACSSTMTLKRIEAAPDSQPARELRLHSYFWGFVSATLHPIPTLCQSSQGVEIELDSDTGDILLSLVTLGIYIPHEARIHCRR